MNRIWTFQTPCEKQRAKQQQKSMAVAEPRRITQQMRGDSPIHWERCNTACGPWAVDGTAGTLWNIGISTAQKHFCETRPGQLCGTPPCFTSTGWQKIQKPANSYPVPLLPQRIASSHRAPRTYATSSWDPAWTSRSSGKHLQIVCAVPRSYPSTTPLSTT